MGTTTFESVRDTQITLVEAITPSLLPTALFEQHRSEQDFRVWASENTQACFRRFSIVDLFDYEPNLVSNTDVEFVVGAQEVVVSYPEDFRYGLDSLRDMRDLMRSDMYLIDTELGKRGTANYTDSHAVLTSYTHEDDEGISFLTLTFTFRFYRSV